jgi:NAD(P)-dependent dehydrogenase (short-subunit alcohol dehydrogenase family)
MRPEQAVVVVTGGNDDIGLQLVTALLEAGHRVAVMDLSDERLPMLASRFPHGILSYRCDVANRAAVRDVVKKVAAEWGRVDVLVNDAALAVFRPLTVGPIRGVLPTPTLPSCTGPSPADPCATGPCAGRAGNRFGCPGARGCSPPLR